MEVGDSIASGIPEGPAVSYDATRVQVKLYTQRRQPLAAYDAQPSGDRPSRWRLLIPVALWAQWRQRFVTAPETMAYRGWKTDAGSISHMDVLDICEMSALRAVFSPSESEVVA